MPQIHPRPSGRFVHVTDFSLSAEIGAAYSTTMEISIMPDFSNTKETKAASGDVKIVGNPDLWCLINKASSGALGFAKSTKAMNVPGGVLVQVSTEHRHPEFKTVTACAEAITFVPGAKVIGEEGSFEIVSSASSDHVPALPPHAPAF